MNPLSIFNCKNRSTLHKNGKALLSDLFLAYRLVEPGFADVIVK